MRLNTAFDDNCSLLVPVALIPIFATKPPRAVSRDTELASLYMANDFGKIEEAPSAVYEEGELEDSSSSAVESLE